MTWTLISGLLSLILGAAWTFQAYLLPRATIGNPMGPILYPMLLGCGLSIMGIILVVQESLRLRKNGGEGVIKSVKLSIYGRNIAIVSALCVGYALLFERAGYVISTFLFLVVVLLLFNGFKRWKISLILAGAFSVGVYLLFSTVLSIQLPTIPFLDI
ncbi:MAG TPA: tripartite tricarboxylate transporter TctB family protein [Spirochaetia bacterium]|nr:tripartite tricarboxylate transporter TctB family protein [Spirochaetia bacterium]